MLSTYCLCHLPLKPDRGVGGRWQLDRITKTFPQRKEELTIIPQTFVSVCKMLFLVTNFCFYNKKSAPHVEMRLKRRAQFPI
jgi:hypothetical protein